MLIFNLTPKVVVVYTPPEVAVALFIQKRNLYLWPWQWHKNRFKPFSICLQSQCNAIITCFHGPGHIWLALQKKKIHTRCIFSSLFVCALLKYLAHITEKSLQQQIKIWDKRQKIPTNIEEQFALNFRIRLPRGSERTRHGSLSSLWGLLQCKAALLR